MIKRITSLLLTLAMMLSLVPLSVIPAMAAGFGDVQITSSYPYDPNPTWSQVNKDNGHWNGIQLLKVLMEAPPSGEPKYIKLTSDLEYVGDDDDHLVMSVNGCVHLDLNGHKLIYGADHGAGSKPFITVNGGSELHIYDSQNGGGYIHYEGKLTSDIDAIPRHLIEVKDGGKLFVNGGKLEAGRSKEIFGTWGECYHVDTEDDRDTWQDVDIWTGNIRQLITGNAIVLQPGSECVINGGEIYGRGDYTYHSAAIRARGAELIINGGYFKGFSGADALWIDDKDTTGTYIINGGEFDTHKNDRLMWDPKFDEFYFGIYGFAIKNREKVTFNPNADVMISGTGGNKGRQTIKVTPKSTGVKLVPTDWDSLSFSSGLDPNERILTLDAASYTPHYKGQEHWLDQDYISDSYYYVTAIWQIYDMDGQPVSKVIMKTGDSFDELDKSVDMRTFQRVDGDGVPQLENGQQYEVRCQLMESWLGYDKKSASRLDNTTFRFYASDIDQSHIKFGITGVRQLMNTPEFTLEVKGEDITPAYSTSISDRGYTFGYQSGDEFLPLAGFGPALEGEWIPLRGLPGGKQTIVGCMDGVDLTGVRHNFYDRQEVFVMPNIQFMFTTTDYRNYPNDRLTIPASGQTVWLRSPTEEQLAEIGMTSSNVRWEMLNQNTGKWEILTGNSTPGIQQGWGNLQLMDGRSGTYRASVEFNGQRWYSPAAVVEGKDYSTSQELEVTSDSRSMEVDKNNSAIFTYAPVRNSGDWGARWYPYVIVYKDNVPKAFYDAMYAWSYNEILPDGGILVRMNGTGHGEDPEECKLFASTAISVNKEAMVPGSYTLIPCVKVELATGIYAPNLVKAAPINLRVNKRVTSMDIAINGENLTNGVEHTQDNAPVYTMSESVNKVSIAAVMNPGNANIPGSDDASISWSSSDRRIAEVKGGQLYAYRPGTVVITMTYQGELVNKNGVRETLNFTRRIKVTVPIAEVKFDEPIWENSRNLMYSQVKLSGLQVRSYNGEWQSGSSYVDSTVTRIALYEDHYGWDPSEKQVSYNDSYYITFFLKPKTGYQFPLRAATLSGEGLYRANTATLRTNRVGSDDMNTADKFGYWARGEWDPITLQTPSVCGIVISYQMELLRDPNTVYVDLVAVETVEPREGDLRYAGDLPENDEDMQKAVNHYPNTMDVRVLTLSGETAQDGTSLFSSSSRTHKISTLQGSGTPYTPLDKNELTSDSDGMEFYQTFFVDYSSLDGWTYDREKLETTRYEAGTYAHELEIYLAGQSAAGTKYYFSPDVRVLVNGHEVQLIDGNGDPGYKGNSLKLGYYFVSDPRPSLINGTIKGLNAPVTGALAQTADELTVAGKDSANVASDKMYVSGLIWFIDANENGVLDEGERCTPENGFTQDGRFMGGKKYSAFVTLSVEAEDGRINNTAFTLKLDGIDTPLSTSQAQGVYTFPETEIVGYGVSGNVESFNSGTDEVTIQLIEQGQSEPAYETIVSGGTQSDNKFTASYSFSDIPTGTYTMKVMKQNHVTREYTITVGAEDMSQDVKIHLLGDINGDGKITTMDPLRANSHAKNIVLLTDYALQCADVVGNDGKVTTMDVMRINAHARETAKLW